MLIYSSKKREREREREREEELTAFDDVYGNFENRQNCSTESRFKAKTLTRLQPYVKGRKGVYIFWHVAQIFNRGHMPLCSPNLESSTINGHILLM